MSQAAALNFLTTLQANFVTSNRRDEDTEEKWIAMMIAELKHFSPEVLDHAALSLMRNRKDKYFPMLSVCLDACRESRKFIESRNPKLNIDAHSSLKSAYSEDRTKLANELVMGEMGRRAATEGWVLSLHDFIHTKIRLPLPHEVPKLKASAKGFDEALDQCRGGGFDHAKSLTDLGLSMLTRRQQLTDMVLHGVVQ